ncbi:MAG: sterol desaturase family protein [Candidatus Hydrogenedentes bacterium]|nr:sterol desaturase family protein [Candidatus Hydrogenedentota bacterium]
MNTSDTLAWLASAKPAVAAGMLVFLWFLESAIPLVHARQRRLSHNAANLALGLINAALGSLLFAGALLYTTEWARANGFGLVRWTQLPPWAAWPVAFLLLDAWMYAWHRLNHRVSFLWRFHAVHHADREMDASSAVRFHTGEIVLSSLARLAVLPLLGITMPQILVYEAVLLPVILFHHSNVRVPRRLDALARALIVTPWMHWVHHSRWQPETDSNFGSVLSLWDRLFGSFRLRGDPAQILLGLDEVHEERQWRTVRGMLLRPFMRRPHERGPSQPQDSHNA